MPELTLLIISSTILFTAFRKINLDKVVYNTGILYENYRDGYGLSLKEGYPY